MTLKSTTTGSAVSSSPAIRWSTTTDEGFLGTLGSFRWTNLDASTDTSGTTGAVITASGGAISGKSLNINLVGHEHSAFLSSMARNYGANAEYNVVSPRINVPSPCVGGTTQLVFNAYLNTDDPAFDWIWELAAMTVPIRPQLCACGFPPTMARTGLVRSGASRLTVPARLSRTWLLIFPRTRASRSACATSSTPTTTRISPPGRSSMRCSAPVPLSGATLTTSASSPR